MPSLSLDKADIKDARAIARVKGGKFDGEILYLHESMPVAKPHASAGGGSAVPTKKPEMPANTVVYMKEMKGMKPSERTKTLARMEEAVRKGVDAEHLVGETPETKKLYQRLLSDVSSDKKVDLDDDGLFELLPSPNPEKREVWYIAGASGSGKSYIARGLAFYYKKLFPDRDVYLVSKLEEDSTLDALPFLKRIMVQSFVDDYPDLEEFKDCMVIFDDYDTLTGDAEKVITKIIDDLAIMGRHTNTTMLCLSHYLTQYKKTRLLLNEATHIVVYPLSTSYHALKYLLKNYVGVEEDTIKAMRKSGSRWLCFTKHYPQIAITQRSAEVLHQD
jgi:hypothetical protein